MTHSIRSIFALLILVIVLAACSTSIGAPASQAPSPSEPGAPSVEPSVAPSVEPSAPAADERDVAGTITIAEGMAFSGPGGTVQEALDHGPSGEFPTLVNGVLFRDTDDTVYITTSVSDISVPVFDGPMLEVLNIENDGPEWDMANAELLGLEEANGIVFKQNAQILGYLELP
ncbi:MAG: hypothetical protein M3153_00480 [Chloroflexota bacterium]|nr:hypothetical protein [Chloroflexota bacterium]